MLRPFALALFAATASAASTTAPTTVGDAYAPVADAHVIQGPKTEMLNYGDRAVIITKGERNAAFIHRSFLRFDLATHVGTVRGARLRLTILRMDKADPRAPAKIRIHIVGDTSWREHDLTWLTQPEIGPVIATFDVPEATGPIEIDVGEAVVDALKAGSSFSFALTQSYSSQLIIFHSRETKELGAEPLLYIQP